MNAFHRATVVLAIQCCATSVACGVCWSSLRAELPFAIDQPFAARDSLDVGNETNADARACLQGLAWKPREFTVDCEPSGQSRFEVLVRFPSSIETGDAVNDRVALEWHLARNEQGKPVAAPAIIVVHESGRNMAVGKTIAFGLARLGLNAFMIQLPGYGVRKDLSRPQDETVLFKMTRQAIADVRRARDAVAVLPMVDKLHVGVQGTSLGGFVTSTSASLDGRFDSVFILLAGADLVDVIKNGQRDVVKLRERFAEAGLNEARIRELVNPIEPKRVAHRLNAEITWLFSAIHDDVVPLKNANILAEVARLTSDHHIQMNADHYSGAIFLPQVLMRITKEVRSLRDAQVPVPEK